MNNPGPVHFYKDVSFWVLLFSNGVTIVCALVEPWSLRTLMTVYWVQSVILGGFNVARILSLQKFSTEGFTMNHQSVPPTAKTRRQVATFFSLHYGFFHFIYGTFLVTQSGHVEIPYVALGSLVFLVNHFFSFRYNRGQDRKKIPNIGRVMFFPYVRILPMHLVIIVFGVISPGTLPLVVFLILKTLADLAMHVVEHR
ncbi:MAG: hypothetical protein HXS52_03395 [Theionarchaea archaeon]|nr:hypothetical protein [Theionarchaea archaeon]